MRDAPATVLCRSPRISATIPIRLVVAYESVKVEAEDSTVDLSVQGLRVRTPLGLLPGDKVHRSKEPGAGSRSHKHCPRAFRPRQTA